MAEAAAPISSLRRALSLVRIIANGDPAGLRLKDIAEAAGCTQPTAHRALQDLMAEGFVEQEAGGKRYRLSLDFFVLAAKAGQANGLRDLARPVLLRLAASLHDTIFLLVRHGYDAVCLDRVEGPFPIRSFTGDIGGRVPLGLGQGSLAILAHLPEAEQEEVIRFNVPRLIDRGFIDEAGLRAAIAEARRLGWVNLNTGLIPGMAGLGVPVFDARGYPVAALSIGTLAERLGPERLPSVVHMLQTEAAKLGAEINPFDPSLRYPSRSLSKAEP
ncbi:IclR family transcriptional regulator [Chelatococcus composti]|jgi:DNA-binding IclR family transcriptional regulator|uniref:DNA-binding IclR family transcriptional regulator n=1 Tax=Chelatococcus composti TaxID=1743235 RepID=A0A841K7R3_9HYPH|nr:IclR family transcriptional regulator [Chelatococcus composti]MBB6166914.1 DNA-binding IclR family transcriptional regulator [Chelatococcus composti]MBS7734162.1 IclR family transcriptional regulator [Chelatococcus composti]GGG24879.1 IclR family transcriptional regulator [Chelatococcus composti]